MGNDLNVHPSGKIREHMMGRKHFTTTTLCSYWWGGGVDWHLLYSNMLVQPYINIHSWLWCYCYAFSCCSHVTLVYQGCFLLTGNLVAEWACSTEIPRRRPKAPSSTVQPSCMRRESFWRLKDFLLTSESRLSTLCRFICMWLEIQLFTLLQDRELHRGFLIP